MTALEPLILKGPAGGDLSGGLDHVREAILSNGIPSNSDGMVSKQEDHYTGNA